MTDFNQPINLGQDQLGMQAGVGKNIFKGIRDFLTPKPKKPKDGEDPDAVKPKDGEEPEPDGPSEPINLGRTMQLEEGMQEPPPLDIMQMGRPDSGNLNLRLMQEDPRIRQLTDLLNVSQGRFADAPSRQKADFKAILASNADVDTLQTALGKPWDSAWTHQEVRELVQHNKEVSNILLEHSDRMAKQLEDGYLSQEELLAFAYVEELAIQSQQKLVDAAAASGRGLGMFRWAQESQTSVSYQEMARNTLDLKGGRLNLEERIRMYAEGKTVANVNMLANETRGEKALRWIFMARYNSMLSSTRSHAANILGSVVSTVWENVPLRIGQVAISRAGQRLRLLGGLPSDTTADSAMVWQELWIPSVAGWRGWGLGFKAAQEIAAGGKITDGKWMNEVGTRYDVNVVPKGKAGKLGTLPVRLLEAEDAVFRTANYYHHLSRLATRRVYNTEHGTRKEMGAMIEDLINNPPDEFVREAREQAKYAIFANDPNTYSNLFGAVAKAATAAQQSHPIFQGLIPFVNTPANLLTYARNNTVPWTSRTMWKQMTGEDPVKRAEAGARFVAATGVLHSAYMLWQQGRLTGVGHPDKGRQNVANTMNIPKNSVQGEDGTWYTLNRLDPAGLSLGMAATFFDAYHVAMERSDNTSDALVTGSIDTIFSIGELMLERSMLSSVSDTMLAMQGLSGSGSQIDTMMNAALLPAIMMPGIARDVRMTIDPNIRSITSNPEMSLSTVADRFTNRLYNSMPILSERLPPGRDWRGSIKLYGGSMYLNGWIPVPTNKQMEDTSSKAILAFGVNVSKPDVMLSLPAVDLKINTMLWDSNVIGISKGFVYDKLQEFIGEERATLLDRVTSNESFEKLYTTAQEDPVVLENTQDLLSQMVATGRDIGVLKFLDWLDGRTEMKLEDGRTIQFRETFNLKDYPLIDKAYREGIRKGSKTYSRKSIPTTPSTRQTIEF